MDNPGEQRCDWCGLPFKADIHTARTQRFCAGGKCQRAYATALRRQEREVRQSLTHLLPPITKPA